MHLILDLVTPFLNIDERLCLGIVPQSLVRTSFCDEFESLPRPCLVPSYKRDTPPFVQVTLGSRDDGRPGRFLLRYYPVKKHKTVLHSPYLDFWGTHFRYTETGVKHFNRTHWRSRADTDLNTYRDPHWKGQLMQRTRAPKWTPSAEPSEKFLVIRSIRWIWRLPLMVLRFIVK